MSALAAITALGAARAAAFSVLVLLLAVAARRWGDGRRGGLDSSAFAIAAATSLLVAAGLALSVVHGVTAAGWLAILVAIDLALLAPRESRALARRALPAALAVLAAVIAVAALSLSRASAQRHDQAVRFTQLWIVPAGGEIETRARVGMRNLEGGPRQYRLLVTGMRRTLLDRTVQLGDRAAWQATLTLPLTESPRRVSAQLFRAGSTTPYRSASVWTRTLP